MKKNLFTLLAIGLVIANIGYLTQSVMGGLFAVVFFLLAPGYLLVSRWRDLRLEAWALFSLSFGLSLLLIMVGGLLLSSLHALGVARPLSPTNIMIMLNVATAGQLWLKRKELRTYIWQKPTIKREELLFVIALSALPLFGAFGAIRINNGASGVVTMLGLAGAAVLFLLLFWRKHLKNLYPYAVFAIGLMVLLALSMRSWYVSGHDVRHEYQLFVQVLQGGFWNSSNGGGDPYNACLSVTVLPTMLVNISHVSSVYVFKLLMQIIFALGLIPLFLFVKNLSSPRHGLLVAMLFIGFPTFVNDMPFLVRQEIAFVFFALLMFVAFLRLNRRRSTYLVLAFMAGLILSHYSSGHVALAILLSAWVIYRISGRLIKMGGTFRTPLLSLPILLAALLFTFFWNAQVTSTTRGLKTTISTTFKSLLTGHAERSSGVRYGIVSGSAKQPADVLSDYAGDKSKLVHLVPEANMAPTILSKHLVSADMLNKFNSTFRSISAKGLQLLLLVGILYFIVLSRRQRQGHREVYFYALATGSVVLMFLMTILPQLSVDYGLTRLFLQTMVIVGLPIVIGLEVLSGLVRNLKWQAISVLVAVYFLHLTGFIPQLIGGYPPQLVLNNSGTNYDIYYRHKGEVEGMKTLLSEYQDLPVAIDKYAISRRPENAYVRNVTDPVLSASQLEYLYLDHANVSEGKFANFLQGNVMEYTYDDPSQRSLMYTNQSSRIYLREKGEITKYE